MKLVSNCMAVWHKMFQDTLQFLRMGQTLLLQLLHDHSQPAHLYEIGAFEEVEMCLGSIAALHCLFGFSHSVHVFLAVP